MHQLGMAYGIGIGTDTSAVIEDSELEVVGDGGVLLIDLSGSRAGLGSAEGFRLSGARLSYLEHGDRLDMSALEVTPGRGEAGRLRDRVRRREQPAHGAGPAPGRRLLRQGPVAAADARGHRRKPRRSVRVRVSGRGGRRGPGLSLSLPLHRRDDGMALRRIGHGALHRGERRSGDRPRPTQGHVGSMRSPVSLARARYAKGLRASGGGCTSDLWRPRDRGHLALANEGKMPSIPGSSRAETEGSHKWDVHPAAAGRLRRSRCCCREGRRRSAAMTPSPEDLSSPSGALRTVRMIHPSRMARLCGRCRRPVRRRDPKRSAT